MGELEIIFEEVALAGRLQPGQILVLGCSTSEIIGEKIGTSSSVEVGREVIETMIKLCREKGLHLAVQCCEHLNRALVVERETACAYHLEEVAVVPVPEAGGSCGAAAYGRFQDPVVVEHITAHAGIDIGDTSIGMQVRFVQVPFRPSIRQVGAAHVTCLTSRPKYIGGPRAQYGGNQR